MIHALLLRVHGARDAVLALAALGLVALLVAPLPPAVLDLLLALNLGLSAGILVVTLLARDALSFASFPTLLLLTTLFRLALNVSSTRLVLGRGQAGRVIEAFGRVVVQGSWVVGAVVFVILTLVQLLVVAKGAERVAEVAARFGLDALPGKQMSIDADLRSGHLDESGARRKRLALERESRLHGAMDGALKFVKGDALAGVAIALVNVVGGLAAGLARGMPLELAVRRYTVLAIGDGLVSQIPALLLALAAGVAVTRVGAGDGGDAGGGSLAGDVARELFGDPRPLAAVAVLLAALACTPGLPAAPFLLLATGAGLGAWRASRPGAEPVAADGTAEDDPRSPVALELSPELADELAPDGRRHVSGAALRELFERRGVRLPALPVRTATSLPPGAWRLVVDDVPARGGVLDDRALCVAPPDELALVGIEADPARDPETGADASLVAAADAARAAELGEVRASRERLAGEVAAALAHDASLAIGVQELQALLDELEPAAPALVREVARAVPAPLAAEVLRRLLEEQVSIRPLRTILGAMLEAGGGAQGAAALTEACRRALRRHIAQRCAPTGPLEALLLDPEAEARLRAGLAGEVLAVAPGLLHELLEALGESILASGGRAPVLLAGPDVRRALRQAVAPRFPALPVLSWDELPPELPVRPLGRVAVASA